MQHNPITDEQLDDIDAWTEEPLGPGLADEQRLVAALVAEVRRRRTQVRFLLGAMTRKDARTGEGDRALREFLAAETDEGPGAAEEPPNPPYDAPVGTSWPEWLGGEARLHDPESEVRRLHTELADARERVAELERPAVEAKRNEIRQSFTVLISQATEDRDHEGAFSLECQLREREEQWAREDAEPTGAPVRPVPAPEAPAPQLPVDSPSEAFLRAEADAIVTHCPDHGPADQPTAWMSCHCPVADDMRRRAAAGSAVAVSGGEQ